MKKITLGLVFSFSFLFLITSAFTAPLSTPLINQGVDLDAEGTLFWNSVDSSFVGSVNIKNLDVWSYAYQLKLEQTWATTGGQYLSQVGRTWDNYIWSHGDADGSLAGTPYAGASAYNVHAANVGDFMSFSQIQTLNTLGHDLAGYFMYGYFTVNSDGTVTYTGAQGSSSTITANPDDSFTIAFYADFSWHVAGEVEKGAVVMPVGDYNSKFLITREWDGWANPLLAENINFSVVPESAVPEPSTLILLGCGLIGVGVYRRMFRKS